MTIDLAQRAATRRALHFALTVPCHRHHVLIGEPCWTLPAACSRGELIGVCKGRIGAAKAAQRAQAEGRPLPGSRRRSSRHLGMRP
ncbi:hypothetical protein [Brachybacterium sp. NPDC056505]|uniref:hypothetical protein n=1 Tax=Brachybacterium sp. NPDC056505 TaxID=3345843 RepID=UPI003671D00A